MKNKTSPYVHGSAGQRAPSRFDVVRPALGALAGVGAVMWIASVDRFDGRHLIGLLAAVLLTGALFTRFADRTTERYLARFWADVKADHRCPNCPEGYDCESGQYATDIEIIPASGVEIDEYGRERDEAWMAYHDNHPEVIASWGELENRWPRCTCRACDPAGFRSVTA